MARDEGIAVKAVAVWSLLGTTDWNSLLVTRAGHYECGAFDVRADPPRLTALPVSHRRESKEIAYEQANAKIA